MGTQPAHMLSRPTWLCTSCHEPWPCEPRRQRLLGELVESPVALHMFMYACLSDAIEDLPDVAVEQLWGPVRRMGACHACHDVKGKGEGWSG
jgi:hypothetical protein